MIGNKIITEVESEQYAIALQVISAALCGGDSDVLPGQVDIIASNILAAHIIAKSNEDEPRVGGPG